MTNKLFLFLFLSFFQYNVVAQQTNYDRFEIHIKKADSLRVKGQYKKAITEYNEALKELDRYNNSTPFFNLAECAIKTNQINLAKKHIRLGISKGGAPLFYLNNYQGFGEDFKKTKIWKDIINDYDDLRKQYFLTIPNFDIYVEIEKMVAIDQYPRKMDSFFDDKFLKNKQSFVDSLMIATDQRNIERLIEITKQYGWQHRAFLLLWHQRGTYKEDNAVWNFFIPAINEEIKNGKVERSFWAIFEDDKSLRENGYTLYGFLQGKVDEKVNERRKSVNMSLLSQEEIDDMNNQTDYYIIE